MSDEQNVTPTPNVAPAFTDVKASTYVPVALANTALANLPMGQQAFSPADNSVIAGPSVDAQQIKEQLLSLITAPNAEEARLSELEARVEKLEKSVRAALLSMGADVRKHFNE